MSYLPRAVPLATLALLLGCAPKVPPDTAQDSSRDSTETGETATPLAPRLLVSGYKSGAVLVLDPADGAIVTTLPGLPGAQATRVHPDGRLLLVAEEAPGVYVADATTFEGLAPLILDDPNTAEDETGGLTSPTGVAFLAGEIVVGDYKTDRLLRYGAQGAYLGVFAEGIEGLDGPDAGLVVGPEGDLWVPCFESSLILRLDASGAVVERVEGATNPRHLWFDAEGALWVSSWGSGEILRRDGGVFTAVVSPRAPTGFVVEPDGKAIWVTSDQTSRLLRLDLATGEALTTLNPAETGLEGGTFLTWR
jgi:DNA-binding beta-propeller fold protein YncE